MDDRTVIEQLDRTMIETVAEPAAQNKLQGWLTIWSGFLKGKDFALFEGRNFVGADKKCDIPVMDIHFPPFSFNVRIHERRWTLIDLDSDVGVIVNEESVFRRELQDEDWIKTGNIVFRIKKR